MVGTSGWITNIIVSLCKKREGIPTPTKRVPDNIEISNEEDETVEISSDEDEEMTTEIKKIQK